MSTIAAAAERYRQMGWHPIPCRPRDKPPLVRWQDYQDTAPTAHDVATWWTQWPDANVALVTGRGVLVVDLDGDGAERLLLDHGIELPFEAPRVQTGHGQHVYLQSSERIGNRAALFSTGGAKPQVDVRGDGGYVIAPPSVHPNGRTYAWIDGWPSSPLPAVPVRLLDAMRRRAVGPAMAAEGNSEWITVSLRGVTEGQRDQTAARLAGYFLGRELPPDVVLGILAPFAAACQPPLTPADLRRIVTSIHRTAERHHQSPQTEGEDAEAQPLVQHVADAVEQVLDEITAGPPPVVPTPFPTLNQLTAGGFRPGEFILLGARPSVGKTAIALDIARHAAGQGHVTIVVSREMVTSALARRLLAQHGTRNSASRLRAGQVQDWPALRETAAALGGLPLWLTDRALSMVDIRTVIGRLPYRPALVIVDYLQLVQAPAAIRERRLQVEAISHGLKDLAVTAGCPVLCLSSLARPAEGRDRRPTLGSLRESGELEHDADIVLLLHREGTGADTECLVAKNRDGETGAIRLRFRPAHVSFGELTLEDLK